MKMEHMNQNVYWCKCHPNLNLKTNSVTKDPCHYIYLSGTAMASAPGLKAQCVLICIPWRAQNKLSCQISTVYNPMAMKLLAGLMKRHYTFGWMSLLLIYSDQYSMHFGSESLNRYCVVVCREVNKRNANKRVWCRGCNDSGNGSGKDNVINIIYHNHHQDDHYYWYWC